MLKEAIDRIVELSERGEIVDIDKRKFFKGSKTIWEICMLPPPPIKIDPLTLRTLTGLADIIANESALEGTPLVVVVESPSCVHLLSEILSPWNFRQHIATAKTIHEEFNFNTFVPVEDFIISLQARFVRDESLEQILKIVGNLKNVNSQVNQDDGITQEVTVKSGITTVDKMDLPNPVTLSPYRTFLEIEQPSSKYIFRLNQGNSGVIVAALFSAEGGMWKIRAIEGIKGWFCEALMTVEGVSIIG